MGSLAQSRPERRKNILAVVLMLAGLFILLVSAGYLGLEYKTQHPGSESLPAEIAGIPLSNRLSGAPAVENTNRLHDKSFPLSSGAVGWYGPEHQATLWVAGAFLSPMASRIVSDMREKIDEGRSPFQPVAERQMVGRIVYELDGMGQKHFYFQSNNLVIWLAVEPVLADQALTQILEFYP